MPTTVTKLIGSGGDYTTLQAWEDACPANLVTSDQVWQGKIKASTDSFSTASGILLSISGTTVDSTHYLELTTNTGASFRDNANVQTNALRYNASNGCAITATANYSTVISVGVDFCRFSNLQIFANTSAGGSAAVTMSAVSGTATLDINNCIIESNRTNVVALSGSNNKVRNSLIVQRGSSQALIATLASGASLYNCTLVQPSDKTAVTNILGGNYGTPTVQNCALFGNGGAVKTGGNTPTYTNCYTDKSSPPTGCTQTTYNTSLFTNITDATRDFRPTNASSALVDAGTTDSTNAANDIAGTARPSGSAYDVGCWELVQASGNTIAVPAGSLSLTGFAPAIVQSANQLIAVPAGSLSLTGQTPSVVQSNNQTIAVPAGSLTLTGQTPTVVQSANIIIDVPLATLTLSALAPTIPGVVSAPAAAPSGVGRTSRRRRAFVEVNGKRIAVQDIAEAQAVLRQYAKVEAPKQAKQAVQKAVAKAAEPVVEPPKIEVQGLPDPTAELRALEAEIDREYRRAVAEAMAEYQAMLDDDDEAIFVLLH